MSKKFTFSLFIVSCAGLLIGTHLATQASGAKTTFHVIYLGTVEGKSYFAHETKMNWTEAQNYCKTSGMSLATITSKQQIELLNSAYKPGTISGHHWINAREAETLSQFVWDNDGSTLDSSSLPELKNAPMLTYCLTLYVNSKTSSELHAHKCAANSYEVLCEIQHG